MQLQRIFSKGVLLAGVLITGCNQGMNPRATTSDTIVPQTNQDPSVPDSCAALYAQMEESANSSQDSKVRAAIEASLKAKQRVIKDLLQRKHQAHHAAGLCTHLSEILP